MLFLIYEIQNRFNLILFSYVELLIYNIQICIKQHQTHKFETRKNRVNYIHIIYS